jgi:hypothetical protein
MRLSDGSSAVGEGNHSGTHVFEMIRACEPQLLEDLFVVC